MRELCVVVESAVGTVIAGHRGKQVRGTQSSIRSPNSRSAFK
jgi:hypothetical protein